MKADIYIIIIRIQDNSKLNKNYKHLGITTNCKQKNKLKYITDIEVTTTYVSIKQSNISIDFSSTF